MESAQMKEKKKKQVQKKAAQRNPANSFGADFSSKGATTAMPGAVQQKMENSFGVDFSNVAIHKDSGSATDMGALAYAQGNEVHFAPRQYNPETQKGQELLGHELAHVVQQRQGRVQTTTQGKGMAINDDPALEREADVMGAKAARNQLKKETNFTQKKIDTNYNIYANSPVQMLKKSNYPWTGTVVNAGLLALRDSPNGTTLADLPDRTLVNVINTQTDWLEMQVDTSQNGIILNSFAKLNGSTLEGFSYHEYIDDAVAAKMDSMLGEEATWVQSGSGQGNTFEKWASAPSEGLAPRVDSITTINCWEMIILAAYKIGVVDWRWINNLYTNVGSISNWYTQLPNRMTNGSQDLYDLSRKTPLPQRGDLVFFDGAAHVALATGNGDEIFTFWPPPNTAFTSGGTIDDVKKSTIEELSDWMTVNISTPVVTLGSPIW